MKTKKDGKETYGGGRNSRVNSILTAMIDLVDSEESYEHEINSDDDYGRRTEVNVESSWIRLE